MRGARDELADGLLDPGAGSQLAGEALCRLGVGGVTQQRRAAGANLILALAREAQSSPLADDDIGVQRLLEHLRSEEQGHACRQPLLHSVEATVADEQVGALKHGQLIDVRMGADPRGSGPIASAASRPVDRITRRPGAASARAAS